MKVVVSIGGSVLAPDLDPDRVRRFATVVQELDDAGHDIGVVVGGGEVAREYIETGRALGANEIELDQLGIAVTRLNARLFITAFDDRAAPAPPEDYERGREAMRRNDIPILGGTLAGQTTDAVSAAFAEYVDADLLIYATSVAGVFDADPGEDGEATKFETLSATELVDVIGDIELAAGSKAPVDLLAAKLIQRSGLHAIVLDGTDPQRVADAVAGEHDGTEIVPPET
jgi:uridylate kinase